MFVTFVNISVKPSAITEFIAATKKNHLESVQESGNLRFDILQDPTDESKFVLYEAYESDEAAAFHKTTSHYAQWRDTVADMMSEPRKGIKYNIVAPLDKSKW